MSKKTKIPSMQHDMSALHRLILVSWLVFSAFLFFAITSVVSLLYTGKNLDKLIERNLIPAIDNSRTALSIGRSLADVNYTLSVCNNEEFSCENEPCDVFNTLSSLAVDTDDKALNDSLIQFITQLESTLASCKSVRQTKKEIYLANEQLFNTINSLDKAVANMIIEDKLKGHDTSILERLPLPITRFMHIQLRLNSLFSNFSDVLSNKELSKKHHLILAALSEFVLETRILSGYGKKIEGYGNQINRLLHILIKLSKKHNRVAKEFFSGKLKLKTFQLSLLKYLEMAESSLQMSSQQRVKSLKKNFNWIPFVGFLLIILPLIIVLFSAQLARSAYKSLKKTWEMRDKAEKKLHKAHSDLEIRVKERTIELAEANKILKDEIAERIEIESALKKREFQLIETQTVAKIGNWDLDLMTPGLDWSNETYKLFDKDPDNFNPSFDEFARLVHPNDLEIMQSKFNNALESDEKPYHVEVRIINDSGREWVMETFGKVARDDNGKAISIFGTTQNVTERSLLEALQKSEKRFTDLSENSTDFIWEFDENEIFTYASPSIKNLLGYSPEEMIGKSAFAPITSEGERVMKEFVLHKKARKSFSAIVNINQHKNGNEVILESSGVPIIDRNGKYHGYRGIDRDITERKKMEIQLQQSQKIEAIGTLAGGIAHDFNNMLGVITGNISYALSNMNKDDELYEVLSDIQDSAKQAQTLTHQLLTFSRGGAPIKKVADINKLIKESAVFSIRGANAKCSFELSNNLWRTEIDEGQINQVISNLMINANQAMPNGGVITIRTGNVEFETENGFSLSAGRYIKIVVEDQGVGISKKHLPNIFDPYFTTKQKGNGLGLATTYSIIKRHDGHITVYSEIERGTVFNVYLPASLKGIKEPGNKGETKHKGQGTILIMDDQESILKMVGRMLNHMGYEAIFAMNGSQAVELYRDYYQSDKSLDLVILDLTIPGGMGGLRTIIELLKIDPNVKAVVSSGYSNDPIMAGYEDYGFCGVVPKPYTKAQLSEVLNKIFDRND